MTDMAESGRLIIIPQHFAVIYITDHDSYMISNLLCACILIFLFS